MKKLLLLAALTIAVAAQFVNAQVNGKAAKPVISTDEKPVYFYIESAANGTVNMGSNAAKNYLGNLIYVPNYTALPTILKHDPKDIIATAGINPDNALWQLVDESGVVKLKNKGTGLYMVDSRNANSSNTNKFITAALNSPAIQYNFRNSNQASFGVAWNSAANGNYIDRWSVNTGENSQIAWFFIVEPGSEANYQEMYLLTLKRELMEKIDATKAVLTNTSVGEEPGQFTTEAQEELQQVIDQAQAVYDTETAEEVFQVAMSELKTAVAAYLATANLPVLSNNTTTRWYFLQGTRPANTYMTFMGENANILSRAVVPDSTQLWKFVSNPNGTASGFMLVNKASGKYLNADAVYNTAVTATSEMPFNNLRFIVSDLYTDKRARFWIENAEGSTPVFRLHSGNASVMNWNGNAYDNSSWLIYDYNVALEKFLQESITSAQTLLDNTVEGDEFGQYSTAARNALRSVIETENAKDKSTMTPEELIASNQAVKNAIAAYKCNQDVTKISSVTQRKWFRLINNASAAYANGKAMSSNGRTVNQKFTYEAKDINSEAQLFRFQLNETGKAAVSIVNKSTGYFMGPDGTMSAADPETEFTIVALDNHSFKIVPTGKAPLHAAQANTEILNWESGAGTASAWKFEFVSAEDVTDFTADYTATRNKMRNKIDILKLATGNEFGQYSIATVSALETLVTTEEAKNPETLTQNQMKDAIIAMNNAAASLVVNTDIKLLVSTNPNVNKWFRIINNMAGAGYASGKAMTSTGRLEGEPYTYENKNTESDAQLFRFVLTADQTKVAHIINKGSGMYVSFDGKLVTASTPDNNFEIVQLGTSRSFWIDPTLPEVAPLHAAATNSNILNWLAGEGSASAWIFEYAGETTGVKNVLPSEYKIRTTNNILSVEGTDNFEVYSVTGQKQNKERALQSGVYFVKVDNFTQKVIVK